GDCDINVYISSDYINKVSLSGSVDCYFNKYETETLRIKTSGSSDVEGSIYAGNITIESSGSSDYSLWVDCNVLETKSSGSSDFELRGYAGEHTVNLSGSSEIEAFGLETKRMKLNASGSFSCEAWVAEKMDVSLSGSGVLRYKGYPVISQKVSGACRIYNSN
ncbi:MAG: DUF2807 domain-containing protein, partial [Prevotellaceae bacterium]|nr:DUF2807 domain-containing protein [Prevotellaceae bacterium]